MDLSGQSASPQIEGAEEMACEASMCCYGLPVKILAGYQPSGTVLKSRDGKTALQLLLRFERGTQWCGQVFSEKNATKML